MPKLYVKDTGVCFIPVAEKQLYGLNERMYKLIYNNRNTRLVSSYTKVTFTSAMCSCMEITLSNYSSLLCRLFMFSSHEPTRV